MAEETTEMVTPTEQQQEAPPVMDAAAMQAELEKVRAALKAANAEAAQRRIKLEQLEKAEQERKDAELSEMEKLQKQYQEAADKAARLEREKLQRQAAEDAGLPVAFAERLTGETLEELTADAKTLLDAMPKPAPKSPPGLTPTNPGNTPQGETDEQRRRRLGI